MTVTAEAGVTRRSHPVPQVLVLCAGAVLLNLAMNAAEDHLSALGPAAATPNGRGAAAWLDWILGDTTEAQFYQAWLAGAGLLGAAAVAHLAARRRWRGRGFDIAYGTGLWPWVLLAAGTGLLLSNALWGWTMADGEWQPTFVPFVSVPPAMVLVYGGGTRIALTAGALGALLVTPASLLIWHHVCPPLDLPAVVANVGGMSAGALLAFLVARHLPWMPTPPPPDDPRTEAADETPGETAAMDGPAAIDGPAPSGTSGTSAASGAVDGVPARPRMWVARRALADFSEAQFYGNEWASAGLLAGLLLAWVIDPLGPSYGSGLVPDLLTAQILTAVWGVWLHSGRWERHGWYPTFVPVVSLAPAAVLVTGGGWRVIVLAAAAGAAAGPPLARAVAVRLPSDFHPFIGSVMSMTVISALGIPALKLLDSAGLV
ncbi:hypothetical protein AGRA3207_002294 [Actinomadura graeca]|uniref:Integral membrane protein n=1 Tax=Actinomadura graeca TaxID=2750812 RepID=A0ABX8QRK1_9ACTN|nr:hypothetical protein [Actinomadura graeca]QXJ21441.1 hypothetical protein AGRA3207_002294 [Actinomadura graeca]